MTSLAAALVEAQKEMPAVEKNARNPHFGNDFVSLDHLIAKTKPVLTKHGLAIVQLPSNVGGIPALATTIIHAGSGEQMTDIVPLVLAKQDMQGLGAALTYARRYAWAAALGISDEADDDGNTASAAPVGAADQPAPGGVGAAGGSRGEGGGSAAPPPAPTDDGWKFPFGKHKGSTVAELAEKDPGYLDWFMSNSDKEDIKDRIREFRNLAEAAALPGGSFFDEVDSDVPFDRTIDGLGN